MRASKATLLLWAATLVSLSACGTARRFGKDVSVVCASPLLIPYCAANDAVVSSDNIGQGLGGGVVMSTLTMPFTFGYHVLEHGLYVGIHGLDACLVLLYGWADLSPHGPEIEPLDFYTGTIFDKKAKKSTDAESGEETSR